MSGDSANPDSGGPVVDRDHDSDLDVMVPEGRAVQVGGETIVVTPLTIGQLPAFLRCLRRTNIDLGSGEIDVMALVDENGEAMAEALAIAVGWAVDEIAAILPDEFLDLAMAVLEVNTDFFVQRLADRIPTLLGSLSRILLLDTTPGHNLSASSFGQGTPTIQ